MSKVSVTGLRLNPEERQRARGWKHGQRAVINGNLRVYDEPTHQWVDHGRYFTPEEAEQEILRLKEKFALDGNQLELEDGLDEVFGLKKPEPPAALAQPRPFARFRRALLG